MKFNYDFEAFFPNEDNELPLYNNYRKTFEYDNEFVLIALENREGIFRENFLLRVDSLTQTLSEINLITKVTSPTNLKSTNLGGIIPVQTKILHFEDPSRYKDDSINIYRSPHLVGSFFPSDGRSVCIFIKTRDVLTKSQSDGLAAQIKNAVSAFLFDEVHLVGRIFAQQTYLENIQREFFMFLLISFAVVVLFLWLTFKRIYGILVPVVIVLISILWTLGIMELFGKSIDIMAIMLPTMIFIAGMSDVVHFFSKYFEEQKKGTSPQMIYPLILKEVGFPTFLTLLTTVVGFLSLLFSSIRPIRDFGIFTSVGVTIAFILTYTLLPSILYFFKPVKLIGSKEENRTANNKLIQILFWIFRHQKLIVSTTLILITIAFIGVSRIKVNNILLEDLSDKVKIKQDFNFFDKHYSGVRPFEVLVTVNDPQMKIWDYKVISELAKIDNYIKREYQAGFVVSPSSIAQSIYQSSNEVANYEFPADEDYQPVKELILQNRKNREFRKVIAADGHTARISAKIRDMGSQAVNEHNKNFGKFLTDSIDGNLLKCEITGAAHLMDRNNAYMVTNMAQGFIFSLVVIGLLTFFLHRSWRMVIVFIIPNIIPLIIIAGIMGFAGIELKAATSLIFSIAFGIATDDTIHFISRLKIELQYGKSLVHAIKRTFYETGKPIILTTFILIGGFISLMFSSFESTFYFGVLTCITMAVALLADLFLLPVLLLRIYGKKNSALKDRERSMPDETHGVF